MITKKSYLNGKLVCSSVKIWALESVFAAKEPESKRKDEHGAKHKT